ncbi:MAG: polysaccharide deacetylase family protein [Acidobacteria bacterium]|nr:polysaccharide deacetylase family protein [Acidobacteriota bacterium]
MARILVLLLVIFTMAACGTIGTPGRKCEVNLKKPGKNGNIIINAKIAKWFDNHSAAISITYDDGAPFSRLNRKINQFIIQNGLIMDYEIIPRTYHRAAFNKKYLLKELIPAGFGYFGHGYDHINHDNLSYEDALESFKRCYKEMKEFGLKPIAYAYPMGAAMEVETRKALADAGFLSGRLFFTNRMTAPYIVPGSLVEPEDWFALPTLVMQDYTFDKCKSCVNNNKQLIPYLDQTIRENAWIILTYHAVGNEKQWGFFNYDEFKKNVYEIKNRDFWNASMNEVTLYIRERAHANVKMVAVLNQENEMSEIQLTVSDGLPNDIYDQPLTILFDQPKSWINKPIALVEDGKILKTVVFNSIKGMISIQPDEIQKDLMICM